jgi:alkylation response protein AidB-like acyl-CoA dehydrogenase
MAVTDRAAGSDVTEELQSWLEGNWDPELTVGEWWERLGLAGWSAPGLPENAYGRNLSRNDAVAVARQIAAFGALGAPGGLGLLLAAPTIATHGTQEQIDHFVKDIVTGRQAWCQLFSEPGAGSDLAGLNCRAVKDGDEWIVNGQKVWTSGGHYADLGMLIARTNADVPKHQGITYFALEMHQPGVEVRPLRELTGRALFNEVFLTDAVVADADRIGDLNNGWAVTNSTLMFERAGLGSGGGGAGSAAQPGTVAGHLERRAGDFVKGGRKDDDGDGDEVGAVLATASARYLTELARSLGVADDPVLRQGLAKLHTLGELGRFNGLRAKAARSAGTDVPGIANIAKLSMSEIMRLSRDLGLQIVGPAGTLHGYTRAQRKALDEATGNPSLHQITEMSLFAQAPPIYGGTDQIQRNIIGERVLGLPKEPNQDKTTPYAELPKNG